MRKQLVDVLANDLLDLLAVVLDVNDPARQVEQALELDGEGVALKIKVGLVLERFRDGVRELGRRGGREDDLDDVGRVGLGHLVSDEETSETIRKYYTKKDEYGSYVVDPHTAVGLAVANKVAKTNPPNIIQNILATAAPAKFSDAVSKALENETDFDFERDALPVEFKGLLDLPRRVIDVKNDREQVKQVIRENVDKLFSHSAATTTTGL
jgi:threonine synthase